MRKTISSFKKDLGSLRTGRANVSMLDLIQLMFMDKKCQLIKLRQ